MNQAFDGSQLLQQLTEHQQEIIQAVKAEDVALDAFLRQEAAQPDCADNEVFRFVVKYYFGLTNPNLTDEFEETFFQLICKAAHDPDARSLMQISDSLYQIKNRRGNPTMQFPLVTQLLHIVNPYFPIFDTAKASFFSLPGTNHLSGFERKMSRYIEQYHFVFDAYQQVLQHRQFRDLEYAFDQRFADMKMPMPAAPRKLELMTAALAVQPVLTTS